jgi:protein-disulfide isomerase
MRKPLRLASLIALPAMFLLPLAADDPTITRQQADDILNELRQIRQLLEKQAKQAPAQGGAEQPSRASVKLDGANLMGSKDAALTMVEFTDYQCPFCQRFHLTTFNDIKKNYIDTGKVRFYSRDLPLDFHGNALRAAQAARCAGDQGQFWQMRDVMGINADKLEMDNLVKFAQELKLDVAAFRGCVESEKYKSAVEKDVAEAMRIGANGTPTFVIGKSTPNGVEGELVVGAMPYSVFDQKLKELATK